MGQSQSGRSTGVQQSYQKDWSGRSCLKLDVWRDSNQTVCKYGSKRKRCQATSIFRRSTFDSPLLTVDFEPSSSDHPLWLWITQMATKNRNSKIRNEAIWKLKTMILNYFLKLNFYIFFWDEMNETRLWTSQASWNRDSDRNIIHFRYDRISFELFKRLRVPSSDSKIMSEVA